MEDSDIAVIKTKMIYVLLKNQRGKYNLWFSLWLLRSIWKNKKMIHRIWLSVNTKEENQIEKINYPTLILLLKETNGH